MLDTSLLEVKCSDETGQVASVKLAGVVLLVVSEPCKSELWVNGLPLKLRPHCDPHDPTRKLNHLKGERFVDHFAGWGLVVARSMGYRDGMKHACFGVQTLVRREPCDQTLPTPGPGGPTIEAPLYVDTLSVLNWNWNFWGEDTRMMFCSTHSSGPTDEFGHIGYEHDTPEKCKAFLQNVWRRIYPGCMLVHGGVYYNAKTEHWIAITCRRPHVGYILNIETAGRGVGYDFTLHAPFALNDVLRLPEIRIYHGQTRQEMMSWLADYATLYYQEPPEWVSKTLFLPGLAWNNEPTWTQQADAWEKHLDTGDYTGIGYSLITNRPIKSGTTPLGYEPDPNHGSIEEFKAMCHRLADRGVPLLIWMSHSGICYQGGPDIDDDWFIRGVDGRICAAWGSIDAPELAHINPGHPGYIEYTKKWIRFYIGECRCKGIFFDCLSWAFPPDFKPRPWMRYPGDTNVMAIKFMEEAYACIKQCDPDAIMLGEGTTLDGPVNVFTIHHNPIRDIEGKGPREFLLGLNDFSTKRLVLDQGPTLFPAQGYCCADPRPEMLRVNQYVAKLLKSSGSLRAFTPLPGGLSVTGDLLIVSSRQTPETIRLPEPWAGTKNLVDQVNENSIACTEPGVFHDVPTGVYQMNGETSARASK